VRFHDLRHTAATIMVTSGVDLVTVKEILGHSSIEMTMRYSHPTTDGKMGAVKALEKQMTGYNKGSSPNVVPISKVVNNSHN
jgi:site-specific recombinase XerD